MCIRDSRKLVRKLSRRAAAVVGSEDRRDDRSPGHAGARELMGARRVDTADPDDGNRDRIANASQLIHGDVDGIEMCIRDRG